MDESEDKVNTGKLLNVREAARRLQVHENTIRRMVDRGDLKSSELPGVKGHRFEVSEIERVAGVREGMDENISPLISISMTRRDHEILDWLVEFLGTSRSEAARTAIRSFAGQMQALSRQPGRPKKGEEGGGF